MPEDCNHFDCYGYDPKNGCPGGCGSTDNLTYGAAAGRSSTKASSGTGPSASKGRKTIAGITLQEDDTYDAFELAMRVAQARENIPRLSGHADYDGFRLLELGCLDAGRLCSLDFKDFIRQALVGLYDVYFESSESLYGKLSVSGSVAAGDGRSWPSIRVPVRLNGTKSGRIVRDHLQPKDLTGAQRELRGEVLSARRSNGTPYDHIDEVTSAQAGLYNRIGTIKSRLGTVNLDSATRASLQIELGYASRMLDYSYKYVPRYSST
ncbi:polymorphic toxin type 28 domain-containing protein [Micromonospora violae]